MKNRYITSRNPELIKRWFSQSKKYCLEGLSCATAKAVPVLESRRWRMRWNKLNSTKTAPPAQDGKQATYSPKPYSWNRKATLEIRSVLCLEKLLLHSAAQWLPGTSSIWRASTHELKSPRSQQHSHGSLRGTAVCWPMLPLEHYAPWQCWLLWLLNPRALRRERPGSNSLLDTAWIKPQFHSDFTTDEGGLHRSHMALEAICCMTDVSLWGPASSFHVPMPTEPSTPLPGASSCSEQQSLGARPPPKLLALIPGTSPQCVCTSLHPKGTELIYLQGI